MSVGDGAGSRQALLQSMADVVAPQVKLLYEYPCVSKSRAQPRRLLFSMWSSFFFFQGLPSVSVVVVVVVVVVVLLL